MVTTIPKEHKNVGDNESSSFLSESRDQWEQFLRLAPHVPGDDHIYDEGKDIPWLDKKLLEKGQKFAHDYIFGLAIAHTFVLLHGFSIRPLGGALLHSGKFIGYEKATRRFLETVVHVLRWYHFKITNKNDIGFRDICKIRSIHEKNRLQIERTRDVEPDIPPASCRLEMECADYKSILEIELRPLDNEVFEKLDLSYKPPIFMSQFDVVLTQMVFILPVYLFPKAYGINKEGTQNIEGFIHLWALIGHLLGIKDEFNMAINPKKEYYVRMFKEIFLPSLRDVNPNSVVLQASLYKGIRKLVFLFRMKGSIHYLLKESGIEEYQDKVLFKPMGWTDILFYYILKVTIMFYYRNFWIVRKITNFMTVQIALRTYDHMYAFKPEWQIK